MTSCKMSWLFIPNYLSSGDAFTLPTRMKLMETVKIGSYIYPNIPGRPAVAISRTHNAQWSPRWQKRGWMVGQWSPSVTDGRRWWHSGGTGVAQGSPKHYTEVASVALVATGRTRNAQGKHNGGRQVAQWTHRSLIGHQQKSDICIIGRSGEAQGSLEQLHRNKTFWV